jgi:hypothetical protein
MSKRIKKYSEAELVGLFGLERLTDSDKLPLLQAWLCAETSLNAGEEYLFNLIFTDAKANIDSWHEEDLKMKFISFVLRLGHLVDDGNYHTYFERTVEATVDGYFLKTKTDFMLAKGILDMPQQPYFHFQEWKRHRDPTGDPVAQLLEAFLCAQVLNQQSLPLYGCTITGKYWEFVLLSGKTYAISESYDCTKKEDLMRIIAILRKFKYILETELCMFD